MVVACIEPVCANIPSCPSIPLAGTPVKPAPLPTKEPLKVEPLIAVAPTRSTTDDDIVTEPVTCKSLVVDSKEPVVANIPSCPSIPVDGIPVKPAPLPTKEPLKVEPLIAVAPIKSTTEEDIVTEPVTSKLFVVACIEPVCANIPSCPSIPLAGTPVKPAPLPTKEPLKVEPLTEVELVKSTILSFTVKENH